MSNATKGQFGWMMVQAAITSDDPMFYVYIEQLTGTYLAPSRIPVDHVTQFLVIVHSDLSADVYVNDPPFALTMLTMRAVQAGEEVDHADIADIHRLNFPDVEIADTDRVIFCFKVGWRFGLFFDLTAGNRLGISPSNRELATLDLDQVELSLGTLYRRLRFYHVYKSVENDTQFAAMMKDGWFPFVEILAAEYPLLSGVYSNRFQMEERTDAILDRFDEERIARITSRWWKSPHFLEKRSLIEAGISAHLQGEPHGFVNSIKNLVTEMEGLLRSIYVEDVGEGGRISQNDLIDHIVGKVKSRGLPDDSTLFQGRFLKYLDEVVFANFNIRTGDVPLSRNSASHGVAGPELYTRARSLQMILILDQIWFYSVSGQVAA